MVTFLRKIVLLTFIILSSILFSTCTKTSSDAGYHDCFKGFHISIKDTVVYAGDDLTMYTSSSDGFYQWAGPGGTSNLSSGSSILIEHIKITQSGWYSCTISGPPCNPVTDSLYINVRYPLGTPPCSLTKNKISNSAGVPEVSNFYVSKSFNSATEDIVVEAYSGVGLPVYYFYFNSNNGNTEPVDGIYYTKNVHAWDLLDDANSVNVGCDVFPFYLNSENDQKIYVSHVNGKIVISFCGLKMTDESVHGMFSGQVVEK